MEAEILHKDYRIFLVNEGIIFPESIRLRNKSCFYFSFLVHAMTAREYFVFFHMIMNILISN
jgi:hypothetical protein